MTAFSATISKSFHTVYPEASVGVMVINNAINPKSPPVLTEIRNEIESNLKENYPEKELLRNHATIQAYAAYYKQYKNRYPMLSQLESVIFKGRSIPDTYGLVQAMFMAELDNMLLTAGHDFAEIEMPISIGLGSEDTSYVLMNGNEQNVKVNDMLMTDKENIISSVIYGPDKRTRITPKTEDAMFVVYGPAGITPKQIEDHFSDIQKYIKLFAPNADIQTLELF